MEFELNYNPLQALSLLKKDFAYYPIELQLVWLSEIMLVLTFIDMSDNGTLQLNKKQDRYVLTQQMARSILAPMLRGDRYILILNTLRNIYVHKGSLAALPQYRKLLIYKCHIDKLAEFAGVTLNWNCSLYKILDVKDV